MRVHLENLEISWNFENFNKYHGKIIKTWKNLLTTKNLPLTQILRTQFTMQDYFENKFLDLLVVKLTKLLE